MKKNQQSRGAERQRAPSKESLALKAAFELSEKTQQAVADHVSVTPAAVRQWIEGERPVPAVRARALAEFLDIEPQKICADYALIVGEAAKRSDFEGAIDALRYALAGIVAVTVIHRPVEALAVAAQLRRTVPKRLLNHGLVPELLATLDAAAKE